MPRSDDHPSLCRQHQRQLHPETAPETIAAELLGSIEDFQTATAVNQALGRLFALAAANRIPPRNAAILAYIAQLLLNTLPAVEREIMVSKGSDSWEHAIRQALRSLRKSPALAEAFLEHATQAPGAAARAKPMASQNCTTRRRSHCWAKSSAPEFALFECRVSISTREGGFAQ